MASNTKGQSRRSGFSNCFIHSNAASSLPPYKKKVNHCLENRYVSFPLWKVWKAWKTLRDITKQNLKLKITVYVFVDNSVCRFLLGCSVTLIKTSTMVGREARDMKHKQNCQMYKCPPHKTSCQTVWSVTELLFDYYVWLIFHCTFWKKKIKSIFTMSPGHCRTPKNIDNLNQ